MLTVTPPTSIGLRLATGVRTPVLPTWNLTFWIDVTFSSAGNLCAIAQRGALETKPNFFCEVKLFTLYTIPSIS